jgi:IS1 family transposase
MIRRLAVEADKMSNFVQKKAKQQWTWIAMDAKSRQVIAFHVGDRSRRSAKRLWAKLPEAYRQHATFDTDQYVVYEGVIPAAQRQTISNWPAKPITSSASTRRYDSGFHAWYAKRCHFPKSLPIISVPSSCVFATTTGREPQRRASITEREGPLPTSHCTDPCAPSLLPACRFAAREPQRGVGGGGCCCCRSAVRGGTMPLSRTYTTRLP